MEGFHRYCTVPSTSIDLIPGTCLAGTAENILFSVTSAQDPDRPEAVSNYLGSGRVSIYYLAQCCGSRSGIRDPVPF